MCNSPLVGQRDYLAEVKRIAEWVEMSANAGSDRDDLAEAKRVLATGIREPRAIKRDLAEDERQIRASFQDARLDNRRSGQTLGLFIGSKGRGVLARGRASAARSLADRQAKALRPIADMKTTIDNAISQCERHKGYLTDEIARQREAQRPSTNAGSAAPLMPSPPPPTSQPPPQWAADPTRRHQQRYWDGTQGTDHVGDDGLTSVDPIR